MSSSSSAQSVSANWAGYAVTSPGTTYTSVTATWTQPAVRCDALGTSTESSFWVGLGGYNAGSQALEQIGADSDCSTTGEPSYYAWYELVPSAAVNLSLKIKPGNTLTASVNAIDGGTTMELQLINRTLGTRVTKLIPFASPDLSSAEWITEAPSACTEGGSCRTLPLADFNSVTFTKIAALGNGYGGTISDPSWTPDQVALEPERSFGGYFPGPDRFGGVSASTAGATPGGLSAAGNSFSVSWVADATAAAAG
ncbi:MAG: G1 family glutamic endopeptidase [Acidimicrobiales bacterium]